MDARPATITNRLNPAESTHLKTQSHLTPLKSHSCATSQCIRFRITSLQKTGEGVPHSLTNFPNRDSRFCRFHRYLVTSLLLYLVPRTPFASSSSLSYTHSLSLQPRSYKC